MAKYCLLMVKYCQKHVAVSIKTKSLNPKSGLDVNRNDKGQSLSVWGQALLCLGTGPFVPFGARGTARALPMP